MSSDREVSNGGNPVVLHPPDDAIGAELIEHDGAWMMAYLFAPFCAVYYPLSSLPIWSQWIAYCLPMTYIFEGMRSILFNHTFSWHMFVISMVLNIVFLAASLVFFKYMFEKSREKGLGRLE